MWIPVARVQENGFYREANSPKNLEIILLAPEEESFTQGESDQFDRQSFLEKITYVFPPRLGIHFLDNESAVF